MDISSKRNFDLFEPEGTNTFCRKKGWSVLEDVYQLQSINFKYPQ